MPNDLHCADAAGASISRRIVADSSCDLLTMEDVPFAVSPLTICTADASFRDDESLHVAEMVESLLHYRGKSSTSCPNPADFLRAFGDADEIFCVTLTGTLSGTCNAAVLAKKQYEEAHPGRRVFVFDSLSTGPEMVLLIERIREMILAGASFDEIAAAIPAYSQQTGLIFMLSSLQNLANNGRVSPLTAKMAGLLGIRLVAIASERGDIEPVAKCRGEQKALDTILTRMRENGYNGGRVRIAHCLNEGAASALCARITDAFPQANVEIRETRGLCSFYAEKGGMLVGYEK